jgi:pantoate--beta-alanine ligase
VPTVDEMYPSSARTTVHVEGLTTGLCAGTRPTHFDGVTTVVTKLFSIVGPCRAYFGRKDAQQLAVVRRMATDLDLPVDVVGCPLVREPDGLAMSSRNSYLTPEGRSTATALSRGLFLASEAAVNGERDAATLRAIVVDTLATEPAVRLDYAEVVDAHTLEPVSRIEGDTLIAVAAFVGSTRLIDNVTLSCSDHTLTADLGVLTSGTLDRET